MAVAIRELAAADAAARLGELAAILRDAVDHGASVNFLAGITSTQAEGFWRDQLPGLASGQRRLFVAEDGARLLGTVLLMLATQPNAPHRAEIGKMLVHSAVRRQGIGRRLLETAEQAALTAGRTLLMLDTEAGTAGEALYRRSGWTELGTMPGHSLNTAGLPHDTVFFYKLLA